jgi:hypothetical protein
MTQHIALYGFTRRKDGLRVHPRGVERSRCFLFHVGGESAAVVSFVDPERFQASPTNLVRHEETVERIFSRQVFLPVKFPKVLPLGALRKSLQRLDPELTKVLRKIVFKTEFQVKVYLLDDVSREEPSAYYNAFSRYILEHSSQYQYKHYFPILTQEAKEAEFLQYAENVVNDISKKLFENAMYWRAKSFCSEKILLDAVLWVRKHRVVRFLTVAGALRQHYPNLKISLFGPHPPYNFVTIDLKEDGAN